MADRRGGDEPAAKRRRLAAPDAAAPQQQRHAEAIEHILYIRWFGGQGQTKLNKLELRPLATLDALQDLPKELVESHYATPAQLPDYCTSEAFSRFTPATECLALPGDVVRTELRLVLCYRDWEYTVLRKDSGRAARGDADIQVMTAEFMGSDPLMAALGLRISLVAYPVVGIRKGFLEDAHERLLAAPDEFCGLL
ncbi:hypothetical protein HT031_004389 [Scenedesmus sp. PABB004]|nr:hypothetical protein HT031_004389 [Scenedesmus sp. PABB004]